MERAPIRVLLVEDDDDDYFLTRELLAEAQEGYSLERAATYRAGLEAMCQNRHDVYLLDYHLDGHTGVELLRQAVASGCRGPAILFTGQGEREVDLEAMKAGAADFLAKGRIDGPLLERSLRYALERWRDRQALRQARDELEQRVRERTAELERASEALRQSEERFRGAFEQAAVGIAHADMEGRWVRVNRRLCGMLGYACEELLGRTFQEVTHPEDLGPDLELFRRLVAGELPTYTLEKRYLSKDGDIIWVNVTVALQRDDAGAPQYCISAIEDITRRKQAEEAVREAARRKDELLLMLAHELRNPLAPLRTSLEVMKLSFADRQRVDRARAVIERQVTHLSRIVDDLLDASRLTTGQVTLRPERLDLARLVQVAAEDRRPLFEQAGLTLVVDTPTLPAWVTGDPTRLTQVVGNLLQNALKYSERGSRVEVRVWTKPEAGQAMLAVRDNGAGIEPNMLPRLFETFTQGDRSLDRSKGGLGLGLAMVRGLVELHQGQVRAASDGPGKGAEFTVTLPLEPEPAALSSMPATPTQSRKRLRVLVVEDNRDSADTLRLLLEIYGYEVAVAYTGPEGVRAAAQLRPDVVLCDIGLPGLDGYGVASALRRDPATAKAHLIAVTGYSSDEDRQRSQEAGFDQHLTKPVDPLVLAQLLAHTH